MVWLLDYAQNVSKRASFWHGLGYQLSRYGGCNKGEICWKITRFHSSWVGLRPSLRLGEFGEEFGGHCLPSYRVACRTIAVAHHCLAPTTPEWPHQSAAPETTPWCPSSSRPHQRAHTAGWALAEPHLQLFILSHFFLVTTNFMLMNWTFSQDKAFLAKSESLIIQNVILLQTLSFPKFSLVLLKKKFWAKNLLAVACTSPPNGRILPGASSDGEC